MWCLVQLAGLVGLAACAGAGAVGSVTVVQLRLPFNELHELPLNSSVEYILDFTPPEDDGLQRPSVLWMSSSAGDDAHPVLVTARQPSGALTWQLPYRVDGQPLFELQRTLCPDDTADLGTHDDCAGGEAGSFSLHVSTSCADAVLSVRAARAAAWRLSLAAALDASATLWAPSVLHYRFGGDAGDVRLVLTSPTAVCATVLVQNYSCPIVQSLQDSPRALRLTMMHSAAVQLSRDTFPDGFYVVVLVMRSEAACSDDPAEDADWLLRRSLQLGSAPTRHHLAHRQKIFTVTVQEALSRSQYAVAAGATLAVFALFYVLVGALVWAQRWPPLARYVRPRAVLAARRTAADEEVRDDGATSPARRRRGSDATYDSSDNSDSDDEEAVWETTPPPVAVTAPAPSATSPTAPAVDASPPPARNGAVYVDNAEDAGGPAGLEQRAQSQTQGPFGLPTQLRLAALARRGGRTLRARSDRYLYTLATVAVFYALPVVQFVIAFQILMNVSGSLDICYYNFLCAHRLGALSDFNHVVSNLGYLMLGALFLLQVRRRRRRRKRQPRHEEYGIPAHYGLLSALGLGMIVVALLSASYHVCPNRLNFQFDTAFMYVLAVLIMVKIYQTRHPDVNARAHATFGVLAALIALVVWGVLGGGPVFWGAFTVLHIFTFLLLSLRIYYLGQLRLEKESLTRAAAALRQDPRPLYGTRLLMLAIGNALNWFFAFYGLVVQSSDFAGHLLTVLLGNALVYMMFYLAMKLVHGERLRWYAWALLAAAAATWAPALYFFVSGSSDWSTTPALSRHYNHECKVLQFYDSHDLWHMLSAVALYLSFNAILTWDDGLSAVKRTDIPVF